MSFYDRIRRLYRDRVYYGYLGHEPLRTGHVYRSGITGENFKITSINRTRVLIERQDAKREEKNTANKSDLQNLLDKDIVTHDKSCNCEHVS